MGNRREDFCSVGVVLDLDCCGDFENISRQMEKYTEPPLMVGFLILITALSLCMM